MPHRRTVSEPVSASRRPAVEAATPHEPLDLDAGHELQPKGRIARIEPTLRKDPSALPGLVCNGAAALVAIGAAFAAARRRRRLLMRTVGGAQVLHLPRPTLHRNVRRAA
jgi:hypothetical protein